MPVNLLEYRPGNVLSAAQCSHRMAFFAAANAMHCTEAFMCRFCGTHNKISFVYFLSLWDTRPCCSAFYFEFDALNAFSSSRFPCGEHERWRESEFHFAFITCRKCTISSAHLPPSHFEAYTTCTHAQGSKF